MFWTAKIIIVKQNSAIFCCFISIPLVSISFGCLFHHIQPNLWLHLKTTISEIISLETVWITTDFSRPISSIKNFRKITFSIFFILKRRNIENVMLESITSVKHSCTMNLFSYCFAMSYVYSSGVTLNLRSSRRNIVFFFSSKLPYCIIFLAAYLPILRLFKLRFFVWVSDKMA